MQEKIDSLPEKFGTVGRYAAVTRDTALFQGMSRAVQYRDFLGKAVAYEHLVKSKKQTPEAAIRRITEMFVNYNFTPGSRSFTKPYDSEPSLRFMSSAQTPYRAYQACTGG